MKIYRSKFAASILITLIIIWLFFSYQLTITYDSAHYTFLSRIINDQNWVDWDPIRGIVFPFTIFVSNLVFGHSQTALMVPMVISLILLYLISTYFVLQSIDIIDKPILQVLFMILIFIAIIEDPLVQGYFHTLLTEYFAATLGMVSCYFAFQIISSNQKILTKRGYIPYIYFILAVPLAWHLKQPYVGTALFPFVITLIMVLIDSKEVVVRRRLLITGVSLMFALVFSIIGWRSFLTSAGMPPKPNRELTNLIDNEFDRMNTQTPNPKSALRSKVENFFAFSNIYYFDFANKSVVNEISFVRANENSVIGYRMYELNGEMDNIFPMTDVLYDAIEEYSSGYSGPTWLNKIQRFRIPVSNILFSISSVLSPMFIIIGLKVRKTFPKGSAVIIICSGTAFLNYLAHTVLIYPPLDRYIFWGYPLNLISIIIVFILLYLKQGKANNNRFLLNDDKS